MAFFCIYWFGRFFSFYESAFLDWDGSGMMDLWKKRSRLRIYSMSVTFFNRTCDEKGWFMWASMTAALSNANVSITEYWG